MISVYLCKYNKQKRRRHDFFLSSFAKWKTARPAQNPASLTRVDMSPTLGRAAFRGRPAPNECIHRTGQLRSRKAVRHCPSVRPNGEVVMQPMGRDQGSPPCAMTSCLPVLSFMLEWAKAGVYASRSFHHAASDACGSVSARTGDPPLPFGWRGRWFSQSLIRVFVFSFNDDSVLSFYL